MITENLNILLADDDRADCLLFKEALAELPVSAILNVVHNGEELMELITQKENKFPDVLFLDLSMPRKGGLVSLGQIKRSSELEDLPVIIFSTASDMETVNNVFRDAANYYICKPADFSQLKKVIYEALLLITKEHNRLPPIEHFMITGDSILIPDK